MNSILKDLVVGVAASFVAGVLAYFALVKILEPAVPVLESPSAPLAAGADSRPIELTSGHGFWRFRLGASALDDGEEPRQVASSIEFLGRVDKCESAEQPKARSALDVTTNGGPASVRREAVYCMVACGGAPAVAVSKPILREVHASAMQEEFDRSPAAYAPDGVITAMTLVCGDTVTRLTAASLVALACSSADCDDVQAVNASVFLGAEAALSLDSSTVSMALETVGGVQVVGNVKASP